MLTVIICVAINIIWTIVSLILNHSWSKLCNEIIEEYEIRIRTLRLTKLKIIAKEYKDAEVG